MGVDFKGGGNAEEFLGLVPILKDDMVLYQPSVEFVWHEPIYGGGAIVVLLTTKLGWNFNRRQLLRDCFKVKWRIFIC